MPQDIFQRNVTTLAGTFTADSAALTFGGTDANLNTLVQNMQIGYSQNITRLYEVGTSNIYYVGGRTMGQSNIGRVIGPSSSVQAFYQAYGNVCAAKGNGFTLTLDETDCSTKNPIPSIPTTVLMSNVVIQSVNIGVQAQEMIISDNTSMIFSSLQFTQ